LIRSSHFFDCGIFWHAKGQTLAGHRSIWLLGRLPLRHAGRLQRIRPMTLVKDRRTFARESCHVWERVEELALSKQATVESVWMKANTCLGSSFTIHLFCVQITSGRMRNTRGGFQAFNISRVELSVRFNFPPWRIDGGYISASFLLKAASCNASAAHLVCVMYHLVDPTGPMDPAQA
jgi:hypothetical protein